MTIQVATIVDVDEDELNGLEIPADDLEDQAADELELQAIAEAKEALWPGSSRS
jgi:hypothetical protein